MEEIRFVKSFVGTPETHGTSTADDFFKAKSEEYLQQAELHNDQDEAARNSEDGRPYADTDIGDADE